MVNVLWLIPVAIVGVLVGAVVRGARTWCNAGERLVSCYVGAIMVLLGIKLLVRLGWESGAAWDTAGYAIMGAMLLSAVVLGLREDRSRRRQEQRAFDEALERHT